MKEFTDRALNRAQVQKKHRQRRLPWNCLSLCPRFPISHCFRLIWEMIQALIPMDDAIISTLIYH